jgi:ABC-2 type transport system permease protein
MNSIKPNDKAAVTPDSAAKKAKIPKQPVDNRNRNLKIFSISSTALFLVILLVFNVVFDKLLGEKLKWDWSSGQMYTIGDVSKGILENIDQPVVITALFTEDQASSYGYTSILPMLKEYTDAGKDKVTLRYIDPDKTPAVLKEVDPSGYLGAKKGDFVVTCAATGKAKLITYAAIFQTQTDYTTYQTTLTGVTAEQSLTGAIKYVLATTTPTVYFTTGHDELDYQTKYSAIVGILKSNNFDVKSLDLFSTSALPDDCATLILADPTKDITTGEALVMKDYLELGGSLMVITSFNTTSFTNLNNLLIDYDIAISNDKIREGDKDHRLNDDPYVLRAIAPTSSITSQAIDGFTLADNVRAITALTSGKSYVKVEPLLTTSAQGVIETAGDPAASSTPGTQTFALLSDNTGFQNGSTVIDSTRIMVVGSSSIFSDSLINAYGQNIINAGLFYYGVQWLAGSDAVDKLYIDAKVPPTYTVTKGNTTINAMTAVFVMVLLPLLFLVLAMVVYRKRKHL